MDIHVKRNLPGINAANGRTAKADRITTEATNDKIGSQDIWTIGVSTNRQGTIETLIRALEAMGYSVERCHKTNGRKWFYYDNKFNATIETTRTGSKRDFVKMIKTHVKNYNTAIKTNK